MNSTATQRPTPETDAAWASWPYAGPGVHANFARKLERERDEAREQLEAMREAINEAAEAFFTFNDVGLCRAWITAKDNALAKLQPLLKP